MVCAQRINNATFLDPAGNLSSGFLHTMLANSELEESHKFLDKGT
jgi:hypothetical protein